MTVPTCLPRAQRQASLALVGLLLLLSGCGSSDQIQVKAGYCPFPPNVADEDKSTMKQFSASVSGIVTSVAGGSASGEIQGALEKYYPAAHDVNRIYALSYAACVACRLDPTDVKGCAERFSDIVNANHGKREEAARTAENYHKQLLDPLKVHPAGK
jgi:hypothetical protein